MQMAEEMVRNQDRDPYTAFANRVKELNYGNSYFFRVWCPQYIDYSFCYMLYAVVLTLG